MFKHKENINIKKIGLMILTFLNTKFMTRNP